MYITKISNGFYQEVDYFSENLQCGHSIWIKNNNVVKNMQYMNFKKLKLYCKFIYLVTLINYCYYYYSEYENLECIGIYIKFNCSK